MGLRHVSAGTCSQESKGINDGWKKEILVSYSTVHPKLYNTPGAVKGAPGLRTGRLSGVSSVKENPHLTTCHTIHTVQWRSSRPLLNGGCCAVQKPQPRVRTGFLTRSAIRTINVE